MIKKEQLGILEARYYAMYEKETNFIVIAHQGDLIQTLSIYYEAGGKTIEKYVNSKVRKALTTTGPDWVEHDIKFKILPAFMLHYSDNEWIDLVGV